MLFKLIGFCALVAVCTAERVPLTVYYESLCPDSAKFIVEQLRPAKQSPLGRFIDVKLVPFGKASFLTQGADVEFTCQHGPNECYGNKVHACAIQHIQVNSYQNTKTRESLTLDYVACLMHHALRARDAPFPGEICARENQLGNWHVIQECANTTEGSKLLQDHGVYTQQLNPPLTNVPTITFNHQTDKDLMDLGLRDVRTATCRIMREPKPYECQQYNSANDINTTAFSIVFALAALIGFTKLF